MAQKPEDFSLPISAISKIVTSAVPEGVNVTDVAKVALSKAASIFVLFATSSANTICVDANRRRLIAQDVFNAIKELDLDFLNPALHNSLAEYHRSLETKKRAKVSKTAARQREEPGDAADDAEEPGDIEMEGSESEMVNVESYSESEKYDLNEESSSESGN